MVGKSQNWGIALGTVLFAAHLMAQQVIKWDDRRYVAAGNGCQKDVDTFATSAGNEISFIMSSMGVDLTGSAGGKLTERKSCRLVVPTEVRAGYYLAELKQSVSFGYERAGTSDGKIAIYSQFYGNDLHPLEVNIPLPGQPYSAPIATRHLVSYWQVNPRWCSTTAYRGNLKDGLVVSGWRKSTADSITLQADGYDVKFEAIGKPMLCH